jgi:hypothetical protein
VFYWFKYTKALQAILSTEGGKAALGMIGMSIPKASGMIEQSVRTDPDCREIANRLSPAQAAITSIGRFGMSLQALSENPDHRLGGHAMQMALINYAEAHPELGAFIAAALEHWEEKRPSGSYNV